MAFLLTGCMGTNSNTPADPQDDLLAHLITAWQAYPERPFWAEMDLGDMERRPWDPDWPIWLAENWDDILWVEWDIEAWKDFLIVDFPFDPFPEWITYATEFEAYHINFDTITAYLSVEGNYYMGKGMDFHLAIKSVDEWLFFPLFETIFDLLWTTPPNSYWVDTIVNDYYYEQIPSSGIFPNNRSGRHTNRQLIPGTYRMYRRVTIWHRESGDHSPEWRGYVWTEFVVYE